jgi:hypothetical protein
VNADESPDGFLSRWAWRKEQARRGVAEVPATPLAAEAAVAKPAEPASPPEAPVAEPLPTLAEVALLTRESDYSRFVAVGVDDGVKRAAMKKLFTDPHFNVMDGLDTYIDDYGKPDPIPLGVLRRLHQSKVLRLFDAVDDEAESAPEIAQAPTEPRSPTDDHADLRLQQDDAAGRPGPDQGTRA